MKRYLWIAVLAGLALMAAPERASAQPPDDDAQCIINCTVGQIMEWAADFTTINLADITALSGAGSSQEGQETATLYTNGNVTIGADSGAELSNGTNTLTTKYQLAYDGDGTTTGTGGADVTTWTLHSAFLSGGSTVTHMSGDGNVVVTLKVQASVPDPTDAPDAVAYQATQILTASWG